MSSALVERAREFRQGPTRSEEMLWEALRRNALGAKVRRQCVIGPFVADFALLRSKLVIEVDGLVHELQVARDAERQRWFEMHGYRVLRFTAHEVEWALPDVLRRIRAELEATATPRAT